MQIAHLIFFLSLFSCRNAARSDSARGPDANRSGPAAGVAISIYVSQYICVCVYVFYDYICVVYVVVALLLYERARCKSPALLPFFFKEIFSAAALLQLRCRHGKK